ncbi:CotO family spore coat protein [Neobacillus sp. WH10]|uniref:CotO family spore coat protein n=1 Tax=Neobacillus sp. WH10 TaxID=3047873 RepID=UPI0024C1C37D|nr:CotO family spore coat protein [Neobacillus sp. WH10]WHY79001.1 CotO family spore coat protein [Neobacillus sp. WH10]
MSKMKSKGPLLYVHQTFSMTPTNHNMQELYTNKQNLESLEEEKLQVNESPKKISRTKKDLFQEPIPIDVVKSENLQTAQQQQTHRRSLNRVKPFKEMDLNERLDYLINFPKVLPPVPCVFYTTEKNHQGYLAEYDHQQVTIKLNDQTFKTVPLQELTDVIMIGIKKV